MGQVFTSPKAIVEIDGVTAGLIQGLTWTENIQRASVVGLGSVLEIERPAVKQMNTFTVNSFFVSMQNGVINKILNRDTDIHRYANTISLDHFTFDIVIYQKTIVESDASIKLIKQINTKGETVFVLQQCMIDSQNWTITEGAIAMFNMTGSYLQPVLRPASGTTTSPQNDGGSIFSEQ